MPASVLSASRWNRNRFFRVTAEKPPLTFGSGSGPKRQFALRTSSLGLVGQFSQQCIKLPLLRRQASKISSRDAGPAQQQRTSRVFWSRTRPLRRHPVDFVRPQRDRNRSVRRNRIRPLAQHLCPDLRRSDVRRGDPHRHRFVRDVVQAEDPIAARRGGAQHGEDTAVFPEHSLLRVRVERRTTPAGLEQNAILSEHAGPERTFSLQVSLQFRQRQFLPVDAPVDPALQRCLAVVGGELSDREIGQQEK